MTLPGTDAPSIARGFDRLAPIYDTLADTAFAGRIHASQVALLSVLPPVRRALVMGGGTGRFLEAFLAHDRVASAVSIDLSGGMTERTAARLSNAGLLRRAELRVGGLEKLGPEDGFDLVVTHCFLDLFPEPALADVIERLKHALEPRGHWLFSDFDFRGPGLPGFARRSIVTMLYAFFRAACSIEATHLADLDHALFRAGLKPVAARAFLGGLLRTSLLKKPPASSEVN